MHLLPFGQLGGSMESAISLEHRKGRLPFKDLTVQRHAEASSVFGMVVCWTAADGQVEGVFLPNELAASARLAADGLMVVEHDSRGIRFDAIQLVDLNNVTTRFVSSNDDVMTSELPQGPAEGRSMGMGAPR